MEALKRKADTSIRKSMELKDSKGVITKIDVIGIPARKSLELSNNKKLSDADRGVHITAAKILVDGQPVVYDDLADGFTDEELEEIIAFANNIEEDGAKNE